MPEPGERDTQAQCLLTRAFSLHRIFSRLLQQKVERGSQVLLFAFQRFYRSPGSAGSNLLGEMGHYSVKVRWPQGPTPLLSSLLGECQIVGCVSGPAHLPFPALLQTFQPVLTNRLQHAQARL